MTTIRQPCVGVYSEVDGHFTHITIRVELLYDPADPYATTMLIRQGRDVSDWRFARDLLDTRIRSLGLGDVKVRPNGHEILIRLTTGNRTALLRLPREAVDLYLENTYRLVPRGGESERLDLDLELRDLLGPEPRGGTRQVAVAEAPAHDPAVCKQCRRRAGLPPSTMDGGDR